jgi:fatty-acyl-CoA synthase
MPGIGNWITQHTQTRGDQVALVEGCRHRTYHQLNERVNRLAWLFTCAYPLKKGDRVAVLAFNCIEIVELFFATAKLGLILVPLNVRLSVRELDFMLADSGAKLLFVDPELFAQGIDLKDSRAIPTIILGEDYDSKLSQAESTEPPADQIDLSDQHLILYTSGTTGRPKGAVLTQANSFWNGVNMQVAIGLTKNDITLTLLPLFHSGGIGLYMVPTIHQGGKVIIQRKFDPDETLTLIDKEKITAFFAVPAIFQAIVEAKTFCPTKLASVKNMMSGGAPLPTSLIERYKNNGLHLLQGYGSTETSPGILAMDEEAVFTKAGSVGKQLLHCTTALFNDHGQQVPVEEIGEIWVKGGNVMQGYWQLQEATNDAFHGLWFKTGDLARSDEDGYFFIAGRKKDLIISGGENIYPAEVEDYLTSHPDIKEAAVLGIPSDQWGEIPIAVIVSAKELKIEDIVAYCRSGLARYKIPKQIYFKPELPRNAAGKVLKQELHSQLKEEA